jgi:hypothetical protein
MLCKINVLGLNVNAWNLTILVTIFSTILLLKIASGRFGKFCGNPVIVLVLKYGDNPRFPSLNKTCDVTRYLPQW